MTLPLSILDLATIRRDQSVADALQQSVALARKAESLGTFRRIWYAEHHNMPRIASAATSVLIAHVAARTERIRLGAGGIMLPNHSPLTIAEQFGTLAELHPGRIDLGLGRAPGTDQRTVQALRRDVRASDQFPQDVQELQGYLSDESLVPGIQAIPGRGTHVPLYILGSSMFGARLAAALGLPYAFASHFAPDALVPAVAAYRAEFRPSAQLEQPHVIAALNVVTADTSEQAQAFFDSELRKRARMIAGPGRLPADLSPEQMEEVMRSPLGEHARHMLTYSAVGDQAKVADYLAWFAGHAQADELMITNAAGDSLADRERVLEIVAAIR